MSPNGANGTTAPATAPAKPATWQERKAEILHRACSFVAQQVQNGEKKGQAIRLAARRFANTPLRPGYRLALSAKSMERYWYYWQTVRSPAVFRVKGGCSSKLDLVLARLVLESSIQTGASLAEAIETIVPPGVTLSIRHLYRCLPKRTLGSFSNSQRQLAKRRAKIERDFLKVDAKFRKQFVKHRLAFFRDVLRKDALLVKRLLRDRERLQSKFFQADARAVRMRERLQRDVLNKELAV